MIRYEVHRYRVRGVYAEGECPQCGGPVEDGDRAYEVCPVNEVDSYETLECIEACFCSDSCARLWLRETHGTEAIR